ncbi:MAG: hypothetical protein LBH24_03750 [Clostridiales bacterium]|nr:hypothetical protein [Clostridiales bacterium]
MAYEVKGGVTDMAAFWRETRDHYGQPGERSHDGPLDYGVIENVTHSLRVNGTAIPTYATRAGYQIHAFAKIEIERAQNIRLDAEVTLLAADATGCVVLPEKKGVTASLAGNAAKAALNGLGDFTFVFDDKPDYALTVYVAQKAAFSVPEGYETEYFEPGVYTGAQTDLTRERTAYYFKKGNYEITRIHIPSDSIVYFESGAFFKVYEAGAGDSYAALESRDQKNVKIQGSALFDFSACAGGDDKTKAVFKFVNVTDIEVSDFISVNANNWTVNFWYCRNVSASKLMLFGYRTYSDGVMLSDCAGGVVTDCFVRTGDDAMEVKSYYHSVPPGVTTDNDALFKNNTVWTDKGAAYGVIHEANRSISNVRFIDNSVGFSQPTWIEHLGSCVIRMGTNKDAVFSNIYFENTEIYKTHNTLASIFNRARNADEGGRINNIYFKDIRAKHVVTGARLHPYAISILITLSGAADGENCYVGDTYFDGIRFGSIDVTPDNYRGVSRIQIAAPASPFYRENRIKINTRI